MPWFNLINMNGRIYDPLTGQFLSPDKYIQAPLNSQSYNRYSYCLNNPLKYVDSSGESFFGWLFGVTFGVSNAPIVFVCKTIFDTKDAFNDTKEWVNDWFDYGDRLSYEIFGNNPHNDITGAGSGTLASVMCGSYDKVQGYYFETLADMTNFMWQKSNDPSINVEISGYILVDPVSGKESYWVNDWTTGNSIGDSKNPYYVGADGKAKLDNKYIVCQIHTHTKSYYNSLNDYDGSSIKDQTTANNMKVPVYSIGPTTISVIIPGSNFNEDYFEKLSNKSYGFSTKPEFRRKTNPFYVAETEDWLKNPLVIW